jgi:hypothetical protein
MRDFSQNWLFIRTYEELLENYLLEVKRWAPVSGKVGKVDIIVAHC